MHQIRQCPLARGGRKITMVQAEATYVIFALLICILQAVVCLAAENKECNMECPMDYNPICGNDDKTYANTCELESFNCIEGKEVQTAYEGECKEPPKKEPPPANCETDCPGVYIPICYRQDDSLRTFINECYYRMVTCQEGVDATKLYDGECVDAENVDDFGCTVVCPMEYVPVCGSDRITYGNFCELETEACRRRRQIHKIRDGECLL